MSCHCNCNDCPGNRGFAALLFVLLAFGLLSGAAKLVGGLFESAALPSIAWTPVSLLAVLASIWGLRVASRQHGRGEPLAVGVFGLVIAAAGLLFFGLRLILLGMAVVFGAAVWSAVAISRLK